MNSKTLFPFIFFAIAGVVLYGGVLQQISAVQTLHAHVMNAHAALQQAQGGNDEQNKLVSAWQNLDASLKDRVNLGVPSGSDLPNLITLLNNAAAGSGLLVENIAILEPTIQKTQVSSSVSSPGQTAGSAPNALQNISLTVSARGDYPGIKAFVQNIQAQERIMDIQSVAISPFSGSGTQAQAKVFDATLIVKVYYTK